MAGLLFYILSDIEWAIIGQTFSKLPIQAYLVVALLQALVQFCQATRWKLLASAPDTPFKDYVGFVSLGYFFNLIAPSILVSDGANAYLLGKRRQMMAKSFSGILTGRIFGMLALMLFICVTLPMNLDVLKKVQWTFDTKKFWLMLIGMSLLAAAALGVQKYKDKISPLIDEFKSNLKSPKRLLQVFGLSITIQFGLIFMGYIGFRYMEIPVSLANIYFLAPFITIISLLPVTPGQIGFREGILIFFYTLLPNVSKEMILANIGFGYVTFVIFGAINCIIAWLLLKTHTSVSIK